MPPCEHRLQRPQQTRPYQLLRESNTSSPRIWSRKTRNQPIVWDCKPATCRRLWPWTTGYFDSFHDPTAAFSWGGSTFLRLNRIRCRQRAPRRHSEAHTGIRLTKPAAPGPHDTMEDAAGGSGVRRQQAAVPAGLLEDMETVAARMETGEALRCPFLFARGARPQFQASVALAVLMRYPV